MWRLRQVTDPKVLSHRALEMPCLLSPVGCHRPLWEATQLLFRAPSVGIVPTALPRAAGGHREQAFVQPCEQKGLQASWPTLAWPGPSDHPARGG